MRKLRLFFRALNRLPEKNKEELTPQEKTDLALKETAKVFKEALNPKSAIKKAKDFFGK